MIWAKSYLPWMLFHRPWIGSMHAESPVRNYIVVPGGCHHLTAMHFVCRTVPVTKSNLLDCFRRNARNSRYRPNEFELGSSPRCSGWHIFAGDLWYQLSIAHQIVGQYYAFFSHILQCQDTPSRTVFFWIEMLTKHSISEIGLKNDQRLRLCLHSYFYCY